MNFDEISHELYAAELSANPAELHGVICGCICGGQTLQPDQLYQLVCSLLDTVAEQIEPLEETLLSLYDYSVGQVRSGGFVFQPLLPDDEMVIEQRVMALGEWCQGFLFGLGQSGLSRETRLTSDIADVLRDLAAIAQVGLDDGTDDDEVSYVELVEYVRVAVLLVAAELDESIQNTEPTLH
ncbi:MAG: UPF0149 family protein [Porticoccaceae bacterium]|nr:UPF0149 family protein [Pseudomonadales bacterium]